jgi:hypothetical protein
MIQSLFLFLLILIPFSSNSLSAMKISQKKEQSSFNIALNMFEKLNQRISPKKIDWSDE